MQRSQKRTNEQKQVTEHIHSITLFLKYKNVYEFIYIYICMYENRLKFYILTCEQ